jgi:hypothetical protein
MIEVNEVEIDVLFDQIIDNVVADVNTALLKVIKDEKSLDRRTYVGSNSF